MTRFARASGSKASNARVPEDSTPWSHLKPKNSLTSHPKESPPGEKVRNSSENVVSTKKKTSTARKGKTKWLVTDDSGSQMARTSNEFSESSDCCDSLGKVDQTPKIKVNSPQSHCKRTKLDDSSDKSEDESVETCPRCSETGHTLASCPELLPRKRKDAKKCETTKISEEKKLQKKCDDSTDEVSSGKSSLAINLAPIDDPIDDDKSSHSVSLVNPQPHLVNETYSAVDFIELADSLSDEKLGGRYITDVNKKKLIDLRDELIAKRVPPDEIIKQVNQEKVKIMFAFKKKSCFYCFGTHLVKDCPIAKEKQQDVCYACGSTEHRISKCKSKKNKDGKFSYATCFICKEQGHISTACPDNPYGLYPFGGGCKECGEVTHFVKNCPKVLAQKSKEKKVIGQLMHSRNVEGLDDEGEPSVKVLPPKKKRKIVKF